MKKLLGILALVNFVTLTVFFTIKPFEVKASTTATYKDLQIYNCGYGPHGEWLAQGRCLGPPVYYCQDMVCAVMLEGGIITPPNN